eukprot:CAMPEP_0181412188 /NCGR_PEP_ID=MMETSP1110-20121109/8291_1 /TAXON_ID=174948 /ORGANISM="Symbiodinium sp., Strain CCMP421" /LENGTH=484 /DNA_ID=CAMNT_0023534889 /DNA_START=59 /DNA_END=1510 /DNA_ORIENTATION=+
MTQEDLQDVYSYPIQDATKAEVQVKYSPNGDNRENQLALNVGDVVWVLEETNGWCGGHKEGEENTGWFPASIINKIPRGDCDDEEAERRSSALYTSDHRAVASPQAKHRKVSAQMELAETKQRFEAAEIERRRLEEQVKGLQRAQSDWENEQQRLTKRIEELQKVQTDWRKEDEQRMQKDNKSLEESLRAERARTRSLEGKLKELEEHCHRLEADLKNRQDSAREDISKSTSGGGHRTPTVPHTVSGMLSGSLQAPPATCAPMATASSMTSVAQVSASPLSARQMPTGMGSRHASPRHGTSWMPPLSTAPPGSPHLRQRVPSQRDLTLDSSQATPVLALVSKFEKRSPSQGAPTRDASSHMLYTTAPSSVSTAVSYTTTVRRGMATSPVLTSGQAPASATIRAGSRDAPLHVARPRTVTRSGFQVDDPETPSATYVTHAEDTSRNFGMSPIKRQPCPMTRGTGHPMTFSPPARTVSVQEKIKQW